MELQKDLFDAFVFDIHDALGAFEKASHHLVHHYDADTLKELSVLAHRIKGTAGLYEYQQLSKLAGLVERLMEHAPHFSETHRFKLFSFLEQAQLCFRAGLEHITEKGQEGKIGLHLTYLGGTALLKELLKENRDVFAADLNLQAKRVERLNLVHELTSFYAANQESWEFFAPEAQEHLDLMEAILAAEVLSPELIHQLFRSVHTLKGAAYMVDCNPIGDLSHRLEDVLGMVREGQRSFDTELKTILQQGHQVLKMMLKAAQGQAVALLESYAQVQRSLDKLLQKSDSELKLTLRRFVQERRDIWEYFKPEVEEHLESFARALASESSEEQLAILFHSTHTIKGAAYTVELQALGDVARHLELIARGLQSQELVLADVMEALQTGHQALSQMLAYASGSELDIDQALTQFNTNFIPLGLLEAVQTKDKSLEAKASTVRVGLNRIDNLMNLSNEVVMTRTRLDEQLTQLESLARALESSRTRMLKTTNEFEEKYLNPRLREQFSQSLVARPKESGVQASLDAMFDELEFDSYNDLNILARTISEMSSDLNEVQSQLNRFKREMSRELRTFESLSRSLRFEVSRTRLVPVSQLFQHLRRLAKDTEDKDYYLDIKGETVEMDAAILEGVTDSMIHLVKNAVVHGIESKSERLAMGKPAQGKVSLHAYPQGNNVIIEVADDGAGINIEAVKTQAVARGLRTAEEVAGLSEQQALELIFLPGLSTVHEITSDAGRGVGMDVVASHIQQMGGDVTITSSLGLGTRFTLRLPLTLLISEALMVRLGTQMMAFPINTVKTLRYLPAQQLTADTVTIAERLIPLYCGQELLGFPRPAVPEQGVVVLKTFQGEVAVTVDEFVNIEQISMRNLGKMLKGLGYVAGATFSSSGQVILLIDPNGLIALAQQQVSMQEMLQPAQNNHALKVLLVDDSISVRKVLSKMLENNHYQVVTAQDGQDAIDIMRSETFDVLLTDLEMPRINGYELIEDVRRRFSASELPILVMTTRAGEKHRNLALELGANQYFSKPIDEGMLLNFLRALNSSSANLKL